jgi:hypothetical protein
MKRRAWIASLLLVVAVTAPAPARTVTLTALDCDRMAFISKALPDYSWAVSNAKGRSDVSGRLDLAPGTGLLMRFSLDSIPKDQRILRAELTMIPDYIYAGPRVQVRRILADWGTGVNYRYSRTFPTKVEWSQPGARGASDRALQLTGAMTLKVRAENTIEVTQDVDLWYTGAAPNRGWILNLENDRGVTYLPSPYFPHGATPKSWRLLITYEPV